MLTPRCSPQPTKLSPPTKRRYPTHEGMSRFVFNWAPLPETREGRHALTSKYHPASTIGWRRPRLRWPAAAARLWQCAAAESGAAAAFHTQRRLTTMAQKGARPARTVMDEYERRLTEMTAVCSDVVPYSTLCSDSSASCGRSVTMTTRRADVNLCHCSADYKCFDVGCSSAYRVFSHLPTLSCRKKTTHFGKLWRRAAFCFTMRVTRKCRRTMPVCVTLPGRNGGAPSEKPSAVSR